MISRIFYHEVIRRLSEEKVREKRKNRKLKYEFNEKSNWKCSVLRSKNLWRWILKALQLTWNYPRIKNKKKKEKWKY